MNITGTMRVCPKCGGSNINHEYYSGVLQATFAELMGGFTICDAMPPEPEHINAICQRCGYAEKEKPLDQIKKNITSTEEQRRWIAENWMDPKRFVYTRKFRDGGHVHS